MQRTHLGPLVRLAAASSPFLLGSCTEESSPSPASIASARGAETTVSTPFRNQDWPHPLLMRLERTRAEGSVDTVQLEREPIGSGQTRLTTRDRSGTVLGTQTVDAQEGILSQEGFGDTASWSFRFSRPFREVPVEAQVGTVTAPAPSLLDTIPFELASKAGHVRQCLALSELRSTEISCPAILTGRCIEFSQRSAFVIGGTVRGCTIVQVWNSTVGLLESRTSSETLRRLLP